MDGFLINAWQRWPFDGNSEGQKLHHPSGKKCTFILPNGALSAPSRVAKTAPYELLAINTVFSEVSRFDYLSAGLRKQAIKGRKQGSRKNLAFSVATPQPCKLDWRH